MTSESAIRREVGAIALMFTGLGSIIGSGWLFGAWRAAQLRRHPYEGGSTAPSSANK